MTRRGGLGARGKANKVKINTTGKINTKVKVNTNVKINTNGGGQECPPHTSIYIYPISRPPFTPRTWPVM
jgi:hypothetical protein